MGEQARIMAAQTNLRKSTKFDNYGPSNNSASFAVLANSNTMPEGSNGSFEQLSNQIQHNNTLAYRDMTNQNTQIRESSQGNNTYDSQRMQNYSGIGHSLNNQKQIPKIKNKNNNYIVNIQQ